MRGGKEERWARIETQRNISKLEMAKKKKTTKNKRRKAVEQPSKEASPGFYLAECLAEYKRLHNLGVVLKRKAPAESDEILKQLLPLLDVTEKNLIQNSGAFGDVEIDQDFESQLLSNLPVVSSSTEVLGSPAPPVPVYGDQTHDASTNVALGHEMRHLSTVLHPAEMKWFIAEMTADIVEGAPVTHTDISDAVIASIVPSTAQKLALQADAQYKYTTAQFLQVYSKLRHVVLEHKLMQAGAQADALVLAASGLKIDPLTEEDKSTPVSAVDALQKWGNLLPMLPGFSGLGELSGSDEDDDRFENGGQDRSRLRR